MQRVSKPVVHSRCVQVNCNDITKDAVTILSTKSGNGEIPLVLIPSARPPMSFVMTVPSGVYCLLQRFGKDVGLAKPGMNLLPPFYRISYVVTKQACTYDAPVFRCPTSDDVRVNVDAVVVFKIVDAHKFIFKLGAANFDELLSGSVDEAIRVLVRRETHDSVISLRGDRAEIMIDMLNKTFDPCGVKVLNVKVTSVGLPAPLYASLERTTEMEKVMEKQEREHLFNCMKIEQESEMQIEEIRRKGEQVLVSEGGRKKRAEMEFEQRSIKAEEDGKVALIEAEAKVETQFLQTKAQLNRTKVSLDAWRIGKVSEAEAAAAQMKIKADLAEEEAIIQGSWQAEKMICEAEATKHDASAEKEASECLRARRQHELDLREKQILKSLAETGNFNLVGTSGDRLINAMMTGNLDDK